MRHEPDERGEQVREREVEWGFEFLFCFSLRLKNTSLSPSTNQSKQDRRRRLPPRREPSGDQCQALGAQRAVLAHGERGKAFFFRGLAEIPKKLELKLKLKLSSSKTGPPPDARDRHGASARGLRAFMVYGLLQEGEDDFGWEAGGGAGDDVATRKHNATDACKKLFAAETKKPGKGPWRA